MMCRSVRLAQVSRAIAAVTQLLGKMLNLQKRFLTLMTADEKITQAGVVTPQMVQNSLTTNNGDVAAAAGTLTGFSAASVRLKEQLLAAEPGLSQASARACASVVFHMNDFDEEKGKAHY